MTKKTILVLLLLTIIPLSACTNETKLSQLEREQQQEIQYQEKLQQLNQDIDNRWHGFEGRLEK